MCRHTALAADAQCSELWSQFERRTAEHRWRRGVACAPESLSHAGLVGGGDSAATAHGQPSAVYSPAGMIDLHRWNSYWEGFSERYGDRLDELARMLAQQPWDMDAHGCRGECAAVATVVGLAYRRVLLKLPHRLDLCTHQSAATSAAKEKAVQRAVRATLMHAAHTVGAVEYIDYERRVWSVQFTTVVAAALFQRCMSGRLIGELLRDYLAARPPASRAAEKKEEKSRVSDMGGGGDAAALHSLDECDEKAADEATNGKWCYGEAAQRAVLSYYDASATVVTKLAPFDRHRIATRRLVLGPGILLPTPFAESLFKGLFEATEVRYEALLQSFLIDFASYEAAQLALHALQYSMHVIFHHSLHYDTVDPEF